METIYNALMDNFILYVALTLALVAFVKEVFALEGNAVRVVSFVVGIFMAGLIYVGEVTAWGEYVQAVFFILTIGLFASGFYDLGIEVRNKVE